MTRKVLLLLFLSNLFLFCSEKNSEITSIWPEITNEMKPWTRWWWMGNAVDKPEIERQLGLLADAGFGGVEITPIYGVKGYEDQYIRFLSDEWMDILEFTIEKAAELGMGVDMNLGTGWPFGGPQITPQFAASQLMFEKFELKAGEKPQEKIEVRDPRQNSEDVDLLALMVYFEDGDALDVSDKITGDGELDWVPEKNGELVAAFNGKTRQKVKRAAPGGEGWSLDHFSKEALGVYLSRFDSAFAKINLRPRTFFNDSYEVYGSSSTATIFEEFKKRKGYDLKLYLRELNSSDDTDKIRRIKADYRDVFGNLLLDNFTLPWKKWSNNQQVSIRNQAHGSPANIIDLYAAADIPECETFGSSYFPIPGLRRDSADIRHVDPDPVMLKFATSPANILGKPRVSSETFTWLGEHFKVSLSQCKPELEQVFLAGVNHVFYHGTTYSPESAGWPGWLFYASVQFGPVNGFWPHINGLNNYIAKTQSILQSGKADSDILIYWPAHDIWHDTGRLDKQVTVHNIDGWLHPTPFYRMTKQLMKSGYLVDFVSDRLISELSVNNALISANQNGVHYKTLIIPECNLMPVSTLREVLKLAEDGATIIFEKLPEDVQGFHNLEERRTEFGKIIHSIPFDDGIAQIGKGRILLGENVISILKKQKMHGENLAESGLSFIRRIIDGDIYYFLVNHTPESIDRELTMNANTGSVILMDPDGGHAGRVKPGKSEGRNVVRIQLQSGESIIVRHTDKNITQIPEWKYLSDKQDTLPLDGPWKLTFTSGGPALPDPVVLNELISWTALGDERATHFTGTARYEYNLDLREDQANEYLLDLGKVAESARIWVNGQEAGVLWDIPFRVRIGKYLNPGENTISVEVANLMANRIRYMDQNGLEWRKFHEINFVNIDYKPFDASGWEPMPSGLLGPVVLIGAGDE